MPFKQFSPLVTYLGKLTRVESLCMVLCHFITYIDSHHQHHNQAIELFCYREDFLPVSTAQTHKYTTIMTIPNA